MNFNDYIDFLPNIAKTSANDGASFTPIEPGDYEFEIKGVTKSTTKNTNKPMLVVEFEVVSEGSMKGRTTRGWYVLDNDSAFALGRLISLLEAAGVERDENGGWSVSSLEGAVIGGVIVHEQYEDMNARGETTIKTSVKLQRERSVAAPTKKVAAEAFTPPPPTSRRPGNGTQARR